MFKMYCYLRYRIHRVGFGVFSVYCELECCLTKLFRLPSLEQKLQDADEILTKTEDEIDSMDSGSINPEDLQLQVILEGIMSMKRSSVLQISLYYYLTWEYLGNSGTCRAASFSPNQFFRDVL